MRMTQQLLMIEDDSRLAQMVGEYLRKSGFGFTHTDTATAGLAQLQDSRADLVILDLMLPDIDGLETCRQIRSLPGELARTPVLMLTAKGDPMDRIIGLEIGADDYLPKPFEPRELLARIRAVLRRRAPEQVRDSVALGELALDAETYRVSFQGQELKVGPTEFRLLHYFMKHAERVHSRSQLLDKVWGDHVFIEERTVDVHVKRLREALGSAGCMVETVRGAGYRMTSQPRAVA